MDTKTIALKLFLDELSVPTDITTVAERKRLQKAVYLGQLSGVDLSYHFSWYLKGPYSPALTRDYYNLAEAMASDDRGFEGKELHKSARDKLQKIRPLMTVPEGIKLESEDWLELLSSFHYLLQVRKKSKDEAVKILKSEKPHVANYVNEAEKKLSEVQLVEEFVTA